MDLFTITTIGTETYPVSSLVAIAIFTLFCIAGLIWANVSINRTSALQDKRSLALQEEFEKGKRTIISPVMAKKLIPSHTSSGGGIGMSVHYSESYLLYFQIDGQNARFEVNKKLYDETEKGDGLEIVYGPWNGSYEIRSVKKPQTSS